MLSVSVLVLASCPAAPLQQAASGFERLVQALESQTLERREAAAAAWKSQGPLYMKQPSRGTMSPLLNFAPYIQEPVLATLEANLRSSHGDAAATSNMLQLLGRCMNSGGAARLLPLVPELPVDLQAVAVRFAIELGGRRVRSAARSYLDHPNPEVRQSALESLLLHADPSWTVALLAAVEPSNLDLGSFGAVLDQLSERELPPDVVLPPGFYAQTDPAFLEGLVRFLAHYPQRDTEDFLVDRALQPRNSTLSIEARELALTAYESGSKAFRWRNGTRAMVRFVRDENPGAATYAVAWTLHRLGEKAGRKHLLAGPEQRAKENPDDWRAQITLGRMQVDVGEFSSAYRIIKKTLEEIDGTPAARRVTPEDYFYAARAAAGARHSKEAGRWLTATRYTPKELAPYRDLPEFEPYLKKEPFNHMFPVAD
jgi:hypothetical protein